MLKPLEHFYFPSLAAMKISIGTRVLVCVCLGHAPLVNPAQTQKHRQAIPPPPLFATASYLFHFVFGRKTIANSSHFPPFSFSYDICFKTKKKKIFF